MTFSGLPETVLVKTEVVGCNVLSSFFEGNLAISIENLPVKPTLTSQVTLLAMYMLESMQNTLTHVSQHCFSWVKTSETVYPSLRIWLNKFFLYKVQGNDVYPQLRIRDRSICCYRKFPQYIEGANPVLLEIILVKRERERDLSVTICLSIFYKKQ